MCSICSNWKARWYPNSVLWASLTLRNTHILVREQSLLLILPTRQLLHRTPHHPSCYFWDELCHLATGPLNQLQVVLMPLPLTTTCSPFSCHNRGHLATLSWADSHWLLRIPSIRPDFSCVFNVFYPSAWLPFPLHSLTSNLSLPPYAWLARLPWVLSGEGIFFAVKILYSLLSGWYFES